MSLKVAHCGNFMNDYDDEGKGVFVLNTIRNFEPSLFPKITVSDGTSSVVTGHVKTILNINSNNPVGDKNNFINDTDSDIFLISGDTSNNNSQKLYVYQSPCTPKILCAYKKDTSSSATTLVYKNHAIQMKEIYSGVSDDKSILTIANDYQKLPSSEDNDWNNKSRMFNVIDNRIISNETFKVAFTFKPNYYGNGSSMPNQLPGSIFNGCTTLIKCKIPGEVHELGPSAFYGCSSLTSVTYQNSDFLWCIKNNVFDGCTNLASLTIPKYCDISYSSVCHDCTSLKWVDFEGYSGQSISDGHYRYPSIEGIGGNKIISEIPQSCFENCASLRESYVNGGHFGNDFSFHIPSSVTQICEKAFFNCSGLCYDNTVGRLDGGIHLNGVKTIGEEAFENCYGIAYLCGLCDVDEIGDRAFKNCSGITTLYWENNDVGKSNKNTISGRTIGESAFENCYSLTDITLNRDDSYFLINVGDSAFQGCSGLTSVTIGSGVESIGDRAFSGCTNLTTITSHIMNAPSVNDYTFANVKNGGTLYVPRGSSGYNTWMNNQNLGAYNWTKVEQ